MTLIIGVSSLIIWERVIALFDDKEQATKDLVIKSNPDQLSPLDKLNQSTRELGETVSRSNKRREKSLVIGGIGMVIGFISGIALTRKRNKKLVME